MDIEVQLAGQVIARTRWENPYVDIVTVRALFNDKGIGFLTEWSDRFKDALHNPDLEYATPPEYTGYVKGDEIPRKPGNFRDSIALQFPVKAVEGTKKPHFFRGDSSSPVNLWVWKSDLEEAGQPAVEDTNASGYKQPLKVLAQEDQQIRGKSV